MTLREILIEAEHRRPFDPAADYAGGMTQGVVDELEAMLRDEHSS